MPHTNPLQRYHSRSFQYFLLWVGAWLIRLPALLNHHFMLPRAFRELRKDVSRKRIQIPAEKMRRKITIDVYEKVGTETDKKRAVHVNFHGSGFMIPSLGTDIDFCSQLAAEGVVVFDADYRKSPEYPFPGAYRDAAQVLSYIRRRPDDFDLDHITVGGFSAGANLAMAVAVNSDLSLGLEPGLISGVVSFYGNTDMTKVYPAPDVKNYDGGIVLPDWLRAFFYKAYVLPGQDRSNTRLSPAFAPLVRWPKHVFCACGTADSLHEPARILVQRLKDEGHKDAEFTSVEREAHSFDKMVKAGSQTEKRRAKVYGQAIEMIKRAHQS